MKELRHKKERLTYENSDAETQLAELEKLAKRKKVLEKLAKTLRQKAKAKEGGAPGGPNDAPSATEAETGA